MVYITTPAIPSCFMAFFSDPYSPFNFLFIQFVYLLKSSNGFVLLIIIMMAVADTVIYISVFNV